MTVLAEEVEALLEIPKEKFLAVALQKASSKDNTTDELAKMGLAAAPYLTAVMNNPGENYDARMRSLWAIIAPLRSNELRRARFFSFTKILMHLNVVLSSPWPATRSPEGEAWWRRRESNPFNRYDNRCLQMTINDLK